VRKKTKYTILDDMDDEERAELRPKHGQTAHRSLFACLSTGLPLLTSLSAYLSLSISLSLCLRTSLSLSRRYKASQHGARLQPDDVGV